MSNLSAEQLFAASEALQREAKRMESLKAAAEVLRDAGTLEARVVETSKRLTQLRAEVETAEGALHLARDAAVKLQGEMNDELERAKREAEAHRTAAQDDAVRIHANAVAEAQGIVEGARADAERVADEVRALKERTEQALAEVRAEVVTLTAKRAELDAELAERNQRLILAKAEAARIVAAA